MTPPILSKDSASTCGNLTSWTASSSHSRARVSTISIGAYGGPPSATSMGHMAAAVTKIYSDQPPASAALWAAAVTVEQAVIMQVALALSTALRSPRYFQNARREVHLGEGLRVAAASSSTGAEDGAAAA